MIEIVPIREECNLHKARLNAFSSDRPRLSGILHVPFFSQVSFKGNYRGLDDMSKTVVGRYSYSSPFENES